MSDEEDRPEGREEECAEPEPEAGEGADFSPWDELHEAYGDVEAIPFLSDGSAPHLPGGGLPMPALLDENEAHCPAFTEESFICVADTRSFVIRGAWGEVIASFTPAEVERAPDGRWRVTDDLARERLGKYGHQRRRDEIDEKIYVEVKPVREECSHLVQRLDPPTAGQALQFGWLHRHCSVRRTVSGAFLALTHESVKACSVRSPYDSSRELIEAFNLVKSKQGRTRTMHSLFNLVSDRILGERAAEPS